MAVSSLFGASIRRREDPRLITGQATYTDDLRLPGMVYASIVRSPHAHARITRIDAAAARKHPGVVAVFTGRDLEAALRGNSSFGWHLARSPQMLETSMPGVFAVGDVRSGNVKRVASAVGEGAISVHLVHRTLAEL